MSETTQQLIDRLPTAIDITYRDGNGGISLSAIINELAARLKVAGDALRHISDIEKPISHGGKAQADWLAWYTTSSQQSETAYEALPATDLTKPFNGE